MSLGVVDELEENVVDGTANESPEIQELSVDPVERGLQEVPLPGILAVKQV
jgi:hypothetical protein